MLKNYVVIQKLTRFVAVAGLIFAVMMTAVPAGILFAAPVQQAAGPVAVSAACTTLQPDETVSKDAWIKQDGLTTNLDDSELRVGTEIAKLNRSLIAFDLASAVPTNAKVTSATLSLWVKDVSGNATISAHQLGDYWIENAVTWRYQDKVSTEEWTNLGGDYSAAVLDSESFTNGVKDFWATLNVSTAAQSWAANPTANYGVILESPGNATKALIKFKSSADGTASQRPKLEVCWNVGVGVSPDNLAQGTAGQNNIYAHTVTVQDFTGEPVGLSAVSNNGWTVNIYKDVNGNGVKDVGDTAITQTPAMGPNGSYKILVEVVVPANAPNGTKDITTVTATGLNNGTVDTAKDTTLVGFPPVADPVLDGRRDLAYTQSLDSNTQDYCDATGKTLARLMTLYDAASPNYVWLVLEMDLAHADTSYGTNAHPSWAAAGKSQTLGNLVGSDKGRVILRDANGSVVFDVTSDYVEDGMSTVSGYGSAGVTGGQGSIAVGSASQVAVKTSIGYDLNRFCTSSTSCTVNGVNLFSTSPPVNADYTPVSSFFTDWQFPYLYEFRFDRSAFGSAGFGSATIDAVHISPNKTGSNEILVTPCNGSIGDRVWQDNDGDKIQDGNEPGLNGVMINLYRDTGNGTFEPGSDLAINTRFTAGDGDYDFTGLGPGVYFVDVVNSTIPADYVLTTANEPMKVELAIGEDYNDADFGYRTLPDVIISKTLISSDPAPVGSQVEFSIRITNTGNTAIDVLPLEDIYDPTVLQFVSATPAQSTVSGGVVRWGDLTTTQGNLAVGASTTVTLRFQALKNTTVVRRATLLAGTNVNAPEAEPVVDGLLETDYTFVSRSDPAGNAPGNLYKYTGASMCYYAFVVDRSYNDNVYASNDNPYLALDGWKAGGHKYSNLDGSDKAIFTVSGSGGTYADLEMDYITASNGAYTVDFYDAPINAAKTSLWYNLNHSGWNGNGPSPQYINGDVEYHSPPYNWNDAVGQYWEWTMIYEFSIPKVSVGADCGTVVLAGAHNSPSKDDSSLGMIGDYIWTDLDAQGDQDETNAGIPNVRVNLYQNNVLVRTTATEPGTSGFYIFSNLPAGTYVVNVDESTLPAGYTPTTANEPKTVNLAAGQDYLLADFGYVPGQGTIGDRVYYDINGDGGLDNDGEPGINNVNVNLYQGTCPGTGTPLRSQVTAGNGDYLFTMLPANSYCVNVDETTLPAGYSLTTANEPKQVALAQDENYLLADFGYRVQQPGKTCDVATVFNAKDQYGTNPGDVSDFACVGINVSTGIEIVKVRNGLDTVTVGEEISYTIRLTNNGQGKLVIVPLQDTYDNATLSFLGATPAPDNATDDGVLNWSDLTASFGQDLAPDQFFDVVVRFRTLKTTVSNVVVRSAIADNAPYRTAQVAAPESVQNAVQPSAVAWAIEIWPSATCSGWSIRFDRAHSSADEQWRAKLDGVVFTSGTISLASGSKTLTGSWPAGVDLSTGSHTLRAEIYEGGSWLYRTATFGPCATPAGSNMCYAVADGTTSAGDGSQKDTLASLNRLTGGTTAVAGSGVGNTNRYNIEAIAFKPGGEVLYAADGDKLGTLNLTTGLFTAIGSGFGSGNGSQGNSIAFSDVDGLSFDPTTNVLYGTLRRNSNPDLLFQINPATGLRVANAFGTGVDYVVVPAVSGLADVDDISVNPVDGVMYAIVNNGGTSESRLITINKTTGAATSIASVKIGGSNIQDIEGLSFFNDGKLYGSSGKEGPTTNALYQINPATAVATLIGTFTDPLRDFEALACLTQSTASGTIGDRVYYDTNGDGGLDNDGEPGINNVTVKLYGGSCSATPTAAIGVDRTSYGTVASATTFRLPHQTGTGINRLMLVGVSINRETSSTNDSVTSIKYGTQSLTRLGTVNDTGTTEARSEIWALVNPPSGTADVTVTFSRSNADGAVVGVTTFTGVNQTTPYGSFYSRSGNGTALSLVVPSAAGEVVFDTASVRSQGINSLGSGQAEQWRTYYNSRVGAGGSTKAGAANVTMSWTATGSTDWSLAAVSIKPASGSAAAIATATTSGDGNYLFSNLAAGDYCVDVDGTTVPATYNLTTANDPMSVNLATSSSSFLTADFGYKAPDLLHGIIGDRVWYDTNNDAVQQLNEQGIDGVTVKLYTGTCPASGSAIQTAITAGNGNYLFSDLAAGNYCVDVVDATVPSGYALTTVNDPMTVNLATNTSSFLDADFGYLASCPEGTPNVASSFGAKDEFNQTPEPVESYACVKIADRGAIGDFLWYDTDKDGIEDVNELGIPNVTLDLYKDTDGTPGLNTATDTKVASTVTDADGGYLFTKLLPGTYFVDVTDLNGKLTGLTHTVLNQSMSDPSPAIVLPTGGVYKDADFGYVKESDPGKALVGDTVWFDDNGDGVQQPSEPGIPNVTVTVYNGVGAPIGSATTDSNGRYLVQVPAGSGYTASPTAGIPAGLTKTTPVPHNLPPLNPGDQYLDADFGYNDPGNLLGTIGNFVFEDKNDNGVFDSATEAALPGVSVDLIRDTNNNKVWNAGEPVIATVTTDKDGGYLFTGLPAGNYLVHVSDTNAVLVNYTKSQLGTAGANNNNQADPYAITLAAGQSNLTADFGYLKINPNLGQLGNQVWTEADGNGLFDPTLKDVGQAGVTVELYRNGSYYATTTTGASGDYSFVKLPSGTYTVTVSDNFGVLAGWVVTTLGPDQGSDDNNQLQPYQIGLPTGGENLTADFGYIKPSSIGDFVWYDSNRDGIQDVGEPGIPNVTLDLYQDTDGTPGLDTATDTKVGSTVTDADGGYLFTKLVPGTYFVDVTDTNGKLTGLDHIVANQSQPDPTNPIVLTSGTIYKDADFGYVHPLDGKAIVGDTVWFDYNGDGRQQPGEPGIPNVTVTVYDSSNNPVGTVDTDQNGRYFISVTPGSGYTVSPDPADIPAGLTTTTPVPHQLPPLNAGDRYLDADFGYNGANLGTIGNLVWEDADNSGAVNGSERGIPGVSVDLIRDLNGNKIWETGEPIIATDTTDQDGGYLFTGLPAETYLVHVSDTNAALSNYVKSKLGTAGANNNNQADPYAITLPAGGDNLTADFGYRKVDPKLGQIGNQVWIEFADGIFNPADGDIDFGQPGVTVDLYKDGVYVGRTTTGASGDYLFPSLSSGTYTVTVSDIHQVLKGYVVSVLGPNPGVDNNNQLQPYQIALSQGGENMTADFAYTLKGALGDYVFYDSDKDGVQDVGEKGIGNVTLNLYKDNGDNSLNTAQDSLIGTATTDNDGGYLFTGLGQGVYFVDVTDTNGVLTGLTHTVGPQSQPDPSNAITLNTGDVYRDADFGYVKVPTPGKAIIGDTVWYDGDGDGVQDPGEPGIPGIQVCATPVGSGAAVCDTTDANGVYQVEVPAGTYTVQPVNPPAGYTATTPVPNGPVTVSDGDQYLDADFGYDSPTLGKISGTIWDDSPDKDGVLDGGETPIPGISVSLIKDTNGNGQRDPGEPIIATDTTDQDGNYLFDGVPAGDYLVLPTDTQNVLDDFQPTKPGPNPGSDNNNQVRPYPVTLPPGGNNPTGDFGYVRESGQTGMLGNQVWYEADGNGLFNPDSGDTGIAGVTVDLYKNGAYLATTTTGAGGDYVFTSLAAATYTVTVSDNAKVLEDYILTVLGPVQGSDNNNQKQAYQVVLPAASSNMTADFGYTRPSSIGDLVWYDADKDGIEDVGEPGIPNVTVNLYRNGVYQATTTTDADGGYIFPGLVAGNYTVDVTDTNGKLTGMTQIVANQGQPDPTGTITLGAGEAFKDADFAYVKPTTPGKAIIGDTVWYDDNGDGVQQPNEPGIPGIQVCATPVSGGAAICTTTDTNGIYRVEVPAGTYTVQPTNPPAGFTATTPVPHGPVTVDAGEQYLDADFGYDDPGQNLLGTIGNLVFVETKATRDGLYNGTDKPLAGVSVDLIRDTNGNKMWDAGEPIIATTTTAATTDAFSGNYLFTGLPAGNYLVHVSDTNAVLLDYKKTMLGPNQGLDNNNQADVYAITLGVGGDNLTADFGYYQAERPDVGVIGNQVWIETDGNGFFDVNSGDVGQPGVTVKLLKDGVLYATTTSGPSGDYSFVGLPAGNYTTQVTDDLHVLASYIVTKLGPNQGIDNNNQLQPYATALPTDGVNLTGDFGYILPAAIGDFVYYDTNKDGIQDVGEPGLPNVAVDLYRDTNNNGVLNIGTDEKIQSTVTDADGGYLFRDLIPGKYIVDVTAASNPNGNLGTLVHTLGNQSATDPTPAITLVGGTVYKDADFGYVQPTTQGKALIGDTVWYDANGDGVQQPEEPGIPGITVRATDSSGNTFTGVTDQTGTYRIEVPQGTYTVQPVNPPAGLTVTTDPIWGPEILLAGEQRLDADFGYKDNNDLFGSIGNLVFWDKNHDGLYNSGDVALGGVSVDLIRDLNGNKVWDAGEPIIATATTSTTVDANTGNYLFPAVVAGDYLVHVSDTNAVLFDFEKTVLGSNQTANQYSKADPYAITLGVNQDNLTADFGYYRQPNQPKVGVIGNQIWLETDLNGLFDVLTKDRGQAGVTVDLYEGGVKLATTTSGASGDYSFVHLPSGTYTVAVSDNEKVLFGLDVTTLGPVQGSDNNNELQPYTVGLAEGGVNLTADFGYKDEPGGGQNAAQIGNMVWSDANNNGVFNTGEVAIGSVVVKLWFDTDSNCTLNSATDVFVGNRTTAGSLAVGNTNYLFEYPNGLRPGNYLVQVTDPNSVLVGATKTTGPTAGSNENSQANPYCIQNFNAAGTGDTNLTADFGYLLPDSRFTVTKVLISPSPARPQEAIQFSIRITNTGATQFMTLPLADTYDTEYIKYVSGVPASANDDDDGVINWADLLSNRGPLLPGEGVEVIVNFIALKDTGDLPNDQTINTANVAGIITDPDGSGPAPTNPTPLPPQSSQDAVIIINPTAVTLANSQAAWVGAEVEVVWQTVSELDVAGFNLLRTDANGVVVTLNPLSIPAQNAGQAAGADYRWVDVTAQAERVYTYTLEIIRLDGSTQPFELGRVQPGSVIFLPLILR